MPRRQHAGVSGRGDWRALLSAAVTRYSGYFAQLPLRGVTDSVDDRRTPPELFARLDREFDFTLDAAASPDNALCERYFALKDDGLVESWAGERVWCNPPYSFLPQWVAKADSETEALVVMLVPANRTEQRWWQDIVEPQRDGRGRIETRFLRRRVHYVHPNRRSQGHAPYASVLLIWRTDIANAGKPDQP